jgi:surface antigen
MKTKIHALTTFAALLALAAAATGCASFELKPVQAPFYVYSSSLLNGDASPAYPREPAFMPARLIQSIDDTDQVVVERTDAPASGTNSDLIRKPTAPLAAKQHNYSPDQAAQFVQAVYTANGVNVPLGNDGVADLYAAVKRSGTLYHATRPAVGDVAFFHNTFDRNSDGRNNDWYTHAGLVESVDDDGTITILSYLDGKVANIVINLENPKLDVDERTGKVWNTPLRPARKADPAFTQRLGGQLFAGFGNLLGDRTEFVVIDNWQPGMMVTTR